MKLKACSIHVRAGSQDEYCTTELCLSVDKLMKKKKKQITRNTAAWKDTVLSVQMSMSM